MASWLAKLAALLLAWWQTGPDPLDLHVDLSHPVANVSERYLSVALGDSLIKDRWPDWQFSSSRLRALSKALSPAYLRLGGNNADFLIFNPSSSERLRNDVTDGLAVADPGEGPTTRTASSTTPHSTSSGANSFRPEAGGSKHEAGPEYNSNGDTAVGNFTMTAADWNDINRFVQDVGWRFLFDFNVLLFNGTTWWPNNAKLLLKYSSDKDYANNIDFQLGNEPNAFHHKFNIDLSAEQLGQDFQQLREILQNPHYPYRQSLLVGPDVTRPRGRHGKVKTFLRDFLSVAKDSIDVVTWHQYYVDGRTATVDDFTSPQVLDLLPKQISVIQKALREAGAQDKRVWLTKTSSAWGGGAPGLSDTYVAGFMWMDKLGLSALNRIDTVMRQTFFGAYYALVDEDYHPRPDYWLSLLYKTLVGERVLNVTVSQDSGEVRFYGHCTNTKRSGHSPGSVTLYGMNLKDEEVAVKLASELAEMSVDQYLMTPSEDGRLDSPDVKLNGRLLEMHGDVTFPPLLPKKLKAGDPLILPAQTFAFYVIPGLAPSLCSL